jgi:PTS system nitrogen regulatory IIA component
MWLESYLTEELAVAKMKANSKKRVLDNIAGIFSEKIGDIDAETLFQHIVAREKLGSTGIGEGIAIPHCRFDTGGRTLCACVTLESPIDYDSVDQRPVDVIFAMIVPEDSESSHLERLAELAKSLQNQSYVKALRESKNSRELFDNALSK